MLVFFFLVGAYCSLLSFMLFRQDLPSSACPFTVFGGGIEFTFSTGL